MSLNLLTVINIERKEKNKEKRVSTIKERTKEKAPPKKITLALKRAVARSKHWCIASVVIDYFALTYEGLFVAYSVCFIYYSKKYTPNCFLSSNVKQKGAILKTFDYTNIRWYNQRLP